jgi:SAM-dependent methyltransferase
MPKGRSMPSGGVIMSLGLIVLSAPGAARWERSSSTARKVRLCYAKYPGRYGGSLGSPNKMENIYTSGKYLEVTGSWHAEDARWKATQIKAMIDAHHLQPKTIAEIGCGSGAVLHELSVLAGLQDACFEGYDISPQAIEMARQLANDRIRFFQQDLLAANDDKYFDILLVVDVFEHVPDYMGFVEKCKSKAELKIFHIPLDIHVSSVLRNAFIRNRYTIGHIHYFTAESAINTLKDTGHEVLGCVYTNVAFGLFKEHPTVRKAVANVPRWLFSKLSVPFAARVLGGYSLLVLTR